MTLNSSHAGIRTEDKQQQFCIYLSGDWVIGSAPADTATVIRQLQEGKSAQVVVHAQGLGEWDSVLINFLAKLRRYSEDRTVVLDLDSIPDGAQRLLKLAFAVSEREGARKQVVKQNVFAYTGKRFMAGSLSVVAAMTFLGEITQSLGRLVRRKANFQRSDFWVTVQEVGAEAFLIVSLIAFLVGAILAFIGSVQLVKFGAGIYVADLVAIGVVREMGAIMTGIIMAGRTGAAFAAQLGTMRVNEEIDALTTMGVDPIDFLVLPKILALVLMLPLLSIYANMLGILGGATVSLAILDVSFYQYFVQTIEAVDIVDFLGGLFKATVYGVLIAIAGCRCGIECGNSAAAVGLATTAAVVSGIVAIVVSNAIMNVIFTILGI